MGTKLETMINVAHALRVSKQTVSDWKTAGCPYLQKPPYSIDKIEAWTKANIDPKKITRTRSNDAIQRSERRQEAETRIKELTVQNMEYEKAITEGELVYAKDWDLVLATQAEAFRRELVGMEHAYSADFLNLTTTDQVAARLREIAKKILTKLHKGDR